MYEFEKIRRQKYNIHCPTLELADKVFKILKDNNYIFCNDSSHDWKDFRENYCFYLGDTNLTHCDINGYTCKNHPIISAEDFIRDNTPKQKFKVGDKVKVVKFFEYDDCSTDFTSYLVKNKKYTVSSLGSCIWITNKKLECVTLVDCGIGYIPQSFLELVNSSDSEEIKVGDEVECIDAGKWRVGGWSLGMRFVVNSISLKHHEGCNCYFPKVGAGVYEGSLKKVRANNINKRLNNKQNEKPNNNQSIKVSRPLATIGQAERRPGNSISCGTSRVKYSIGHISNKVILV